MNARDLIIGLRGGVPERCDFCGQPCEPDDLEPEECGDWVCPNCREAWEKNEREAAQ